MAAPVPGAWACAWAPAKLNLELDVLGRRADGFHELATTMVAIDLADQVFARRRAEPGISLSIEGPQASADIPRDERNLAWRAARVLLDAGGTGGGLELRLLKNIPSQAGLGGGSSDAAAALLAAESALSLPLQKEARAEHVQSLGSDCVFFVEVENTGIGLCEGRGERVEELAANVDEWVFAIVSPTVKCATSEVFGALGIPLSAPLRASRVRSHLFSKTATKARAWLFNHLEEAAYRSTPELQIWREVLRASDADHFRLSGSGSSFFGLYEDEESALSSLRRIRARAEALDLGLRGSWVCRSFGSGARLAGTQS